MLFAAFDPTIIVGVILTGISTLLGVYATVLSRHTEEKTVTREETEQALKAQDALLNRYEERIEKLETRQTVLEQDLEKVRGERNKALAELATEKDAHVRCEERLDEANAVIKDLLAKIDSLKGGNE